MSNQHHSHHEPEHVIFDVWFDGGYRGHIPLMEAMVVIQGKDHYRSWPESGGNNQAEAKAAIFACELLAQTLVPPGAVLRMKGDSKLIIDFMNGDAEPNKLRSLIDDLKSARGLLPPVEWHFVPRQSNLAGKALEQYQNRVSRGLCSDLNQNSHQTDLEDTAIFTRNMNQF